MCVCVCVCLSLCLLSHKSHLTLEASLSLENAVTYSAGDEGQDIFSETALPVCKFSKSVLNKLQLVPLKLMKKCVWKL